MWAIPIFTVVFQIIHLDIFLILCYLPPKDKKELGRDQMDYLVDKLYLIQNQAVQGWLHHLGNDNVALKYCIELLFTDKSQNDTAIVIWCVPCPSQASVVKTTTESKAIKPRYKKYGNSVFSVFALNLWNDHTLM